MKTFPTYKNIARAALPSPPAFRVLETNFSGMNSCTLKDRYMINDPRIQRLVELWRAENPNQIARDMESLRSRIENAMTTGGPLSTEDLRTLAFYMDNLIALQILSEREFRNLT
jgi:hypothetical protein